MDEDTRKALAKLIWLDPFTSQTNERLIYDGDKLSIGRDAQNEIQLTESHISRQHATLGCDQREFTIDDLGSANGTFINGVQVYGKNALAIGDEVHLFVSVLKLVAADESPPADPADRVNVVAGDRASLRITKGPQQGQVFALLKEEMYIGRSTPSANWEIALQDPTVSRPHAFVVREKQQWKLFDLGSINGTAVNNRPVTGGKAQLLRDGDRISFGGTMTVFHAGFPVRQKQLENHQNGNS